MKNIYKRIKKEHNKTTLRYTPLKLVNKRFYYFLLTYFITTLIIIILIIILANTVGAVVNDSGILTIKIQHSISPETLEVVKQFINQTIGG